VIERRRQAPKAGRPVHGPPACCRASLRTELDRKDWQAFRAKSGAGHELPIESDVWQVRFPACSGRNAASRPISAVLRLCRSQALKRRTRHELTSPCRRRYDLYENVQESATDHLHRSEVRTDSYQRPQHDLHQAVYTIKVMMKPSGQVSVVYQDIRHIIEPTIAV
jgi:hypothetical protein